MFPGEKADNISALPRNPEDFGTVPTHLCWASGDQEEILLGAGHVEAEIVGRGLSQNGRPRGQHQKAAI